MQLELFQSGPKSPEPPQLWKDVSQEHRTTIVNLLARLMEKAVRQEAKDARNE